MNVMLTSYCNQKCPYCFGQDAMFGSEGEKSDIEISKTNLQFVLDFLKRSGVKKFSMIGGEPTLHSAFKQRYEQIEKAGMSVWMFSNCVMDEDIAVYLSKKRSLANILLNIREPWEYSKEDWNKILAALKYIKKRPLAFVSTSWDLRCDFYSI